MRAFRALYPLALVVAGGCNCAQRVQKVDPALGDVPDGVDFGLVAVGDSATQTIRLDALTSADLTLDAHLEAPAGPFALVPAAPKTIPGDGSVTLTLVYTPTEVGADAATLVVDTDDPDFTRGRKRILLSGQADSPQIQVTPDHLTLSAVACPQGASSSRCTDAQPFEIDNVGQVRLSLGTVDLEPMDDAHPLPPGAQLGIAPLVSTTELEAGAKVASKIVWKPQPSLLAGGVGQDFEAKLVVPSNDPAKPKVEIPIVAHADPNSPPTACIQVFEVTRREYVADPNGGPPTVQSVGVPASDYTCASAADHCTPGEVQVRPGMTVTLTSAGTDPATGQPCTVDPEGDAVKLQWSISDEPDASRAHTSPVDQPQTKIDIDEVGRYTVNLVATDSLQLHGTASVVLNAIPRDDVAVQLSWTDAPDGVDLDLHLLTDAGPNVPGAASPFCVQDTSFFNPSPDVFHTNGAADQIPQLLRDDQGNAGHFEDVSLVTAPPGSKFRVAVHRFPDSQTTAPATPKVEVILKGTEYGPFSPSQPLGADNDFWIGAQIDFPADGSTPGATAEDTRLQPVTDASTQTDQLTGDALPGYYWPFDHYDFSVPTCP